MKKILLLCLISFRCIFLTVFGSEANDLQHQLLTEVGILMIPMEALGFIFAIFGALETGLKSMFFPGCPETPSDLVTRLMEGT